MKALVTLHCGHQIMSSNPAQRYCNRKCSGYFVSRRSTAKKRNKQVPDASSKLVNHLYRYIPSHDPVWREKAKRFETKKGYIDLIYWCPELKMVFRRREHKVIWEVFNNVSLPRNWVIHHKDENPSNNDPFNLLALTKSLHQEQHRRLEYLKTQYYGLQYMVQRHLLNQEYAELAKEMVERLRGWYDE